MCTDKMHYIYFAGETQLFFNVGHATSTDIKSVKNESYGVLGVELKDNVAYSSAQTQPVAHSHCGNDYTLNYTLNKLLLCALTRCTKSI